MNPPGNTTIICYDVPQNLLHKTEAKRYFQSFGRIVKIIVKPKSHKCIVEYQTPEAAEEALSLGGEYEGVEFRIEYKLKTAAKEVKEKRCTKKDPDPDWQLDADVQAELEAMGAIAGKKQYNLRPEKMAVDVELSSLVKKATKAERAEAKKRASTIADAGIALKKSSIQQERELMNIICQQAYTTEDKYRILDARDKLIRLEKRKEHVNQLEVTVGTCPDMCPEKERLMREVQHQVALYEQSSDPGDRSMDHRIAVKQYSRSSADQEAPLPHELRGVAVLQMTMGYLMHRIMPLVDENDDDNEGVNLGEWFHFLWDRMRGIRKDITQQELCCQGSVELVEQCARYHVHCSARLVAEDPSVFDQKINTENLTKCLQTLKYMYHDLAIKGERCPNEAEFRAYVILLNLNDGNFMWEVQQLSLDIQKSAEIKFALEVYSSLDTNNFVRFFKLVRSTTYLNACILLRYFMQVRTKAMRMIAKCYTPRTSHAHIPVAQITEMLAFEDEEACVDFVESCGLNVDGAERRTVLLSKQDFVEPDGSYVLDRAVNIIESKRRYQLGEVVCGGHLPPPLFENHIPEDSFTEDGFLKNAVDFSTDVPDRRERETVSIRDLRRHKERDDSNSRECWALPTPRLPTGIFAPTASTITDKTENSSEPPAVGGFVFDLPPILSKQNQEEEERARREMQEEAERLKLLAEKERLLNELRLEEQREKQRLDSEAKAKAEECRLQAEREHIQRLALQRQQDERLRLEREERIRIENERCKRQREEERRLLDIQEAEKHRIAEEVHKRAHSEAVQLRQIHSSVSTLLADLVTTVEGIVIDEKTKKLRERALSRFVIRKWRNRITVNVRKRKAVDLGPLWINRMTNEEMARELYTPQQELTLNLMKRYKRGVAETSADRKHCIEVKKLNLQALTANNLLANGMRSKRLQNEIFWKVGIYFECNVLVRKTLNMAIGWDHTEVLLERIKQSQNNFTYCLQSSKMAQTEIMDGLIIVVRQLSELLIDRLLAYLNTLGDLVCMPVFFILEEEDANLRMEIETLLHNKLISEEATLICDYTPKNLVVALGRGLAFLSTQYQPHPPLLLNTLRSFLGENLGGEFFQRVRACSKWNLPYKQCVSRPDITIDLFNQALTKLEESASNEQRLEYSSFPEIFKEHLQNEIPDYLPCDYKYFPAFWKSEEYKKTLRDVLKQFYLPDYDGTWPLKDSRELENYVRRYCKLIYNSPLEIEKLFLKIMAKLLRANGAQSWLDVAEIILECKLKSLDLSLPDDLKAKTIFNQLIVIYQSEELQANNNETWYYLKNPLIQNALSSCEDEYPEAVEDNIARDDVVLEEIPLDLEMHMKRAFEPEAQEDEQQANVKKCRDAMDDFRLLLNDLEESMRIQRIVSQKFQANLQSYLDAV